MIIDDAYADILERCLRLEAQIARLEGRATESPPPPAPVLTSPLHFVRRIMRAPTVDEITQMCKLRRRGMSYEEIARRVSRSEWTARQYTKDVLIERKAGDR